MVDVEVLPEEKRLSIVIPVLNEELTIGELLLQLRPLKSLQCEVIVVDGGSTDNTVSVAETWADSVIASAKGRAAQMNRGAEFARGQYVLFLHADSCLPSDFEDFLSVLLQAKPSWGFFPLLLSGKSFGLRIIERAISLRSKLTAVATGDQCLFFQRDFFQRLHSLLVALIRLF
mgnify:CR=1 FL=1